MKNLITGLLVFGLAGAGAFCWWILKVRREQHARAHLKDTLIACQHLLVLTDHLQQHRGMSSAWLSGDASFEGRLLEKRRQIEAVFPVLLAAARLESMQANACLTGNDISLFHFRWQSLVEGLSGMSTESSMAQHSHMVSQVLEWLSALGEARIEPLAGRVVSIGMIRNYAHRLPALTECLGQARAIGSSVAARHGCSPVARVRLMFLVARAEALLEQAATAHNNGNLTLRARHAVQEMARTVRTSMLLSAGVQMAPGEYFSVSTQAIDSIYAWIEDGSRTISGATASMERRGVAPDVLGKVA